MIVTEEEDGEDADNVEDVEDVEDGDGPTSVEAEPGMKLVQIGRDPRALRDATQEDINACKWEYRCRLCDRVGELICCEHDEGCCVSMHIRCTAVSESALTTGKWVCLNHDDTRRRRKKRALHGDMHFTADDEDTVSEGDVQRLIIGNGQRNQICQLVKDPSHVPSFRFTSLSCLHLHGT